MATNLHCTELHWVVLARIWYDVVQQQLRVVCNSKAWYGKQGLVMVWYRKVWYGTATCPWTWAPTYSSTTLAGFSFDRSAFHLIAVSAAIVVG